MSVSVTLTAQQCKRARSLLKWNLQDLANHTRLKISILDAFEHGKSKLQRPENAEVVKTLKKEGIDFKSNGEVSLKRGGKGHSTSAQDHTVYEIDHTLDITGQGNTGEDAGQSPRKNPGPQGTPIS